MLPSRATARLAPLLALVVAVGLVVIAVRAAGSAPPRAAVGDVVDPYFSQDDLTGEEITVRVPWGELVIRSDGPRERLPDDFGQAEALLAPEDGGFVRVDVAAPTDRRLVTGTVTANRFDTGLALVVGEDEVPLTDVPGGFALDEEWSSEPETRYVAVGADADADDLALRITYDSLVQEVDLATGEVDAGPLAALADVPVADPGGYGALLSTPCGEPRVSGDLRPDDDEAPTCAVEHGPPLPYVHGLGPAPQGQRFVVLSVPVDEITTLRARDGAYVYARFRVQRIEVAGRPVEGPAWPGPPQDARSAPPSDTGVAVVEEGADTVPARVVLAAVGADAAVRRTRVTYDVELQVGP